jgi:hypothetical protein
LEQQGPYADEDCWNSMRDGAPFDQGAVTHWRTYQAPGGAS